MTEKFRPNAALKIKSQCKCPNSFLCCIPPTFHDATSYISQSYKLFPTSHYQRTSGHCLETFRPVNLLLSLNYRGADKSLARNYWKKQLKCRHFSSDAEVIAAAETRLDGQPSEFLSGLKKLDLVAVACFLPGWANDLSAPRYNSNFGASQCTRIHHFLILLILLIPAANCQYFTRNFF